MTRALLASVSFAATVVTACSLSSGLDGLMGGEEDAKKVVADGGTGASDASEDVPRDAATDGSSTPPSVDAGEDAGVVVNLHPNGTFEQGCGRWTPYQSAIQMATTARTGTGSCRTCANQGATDVYGMSDDGAVADPPVGAVYRASAWVRAAGSATPSATVGVFLRTFSAANGFTQIELGEGSTLPAVDGTWRFVEVTFEVTKPAPFLQVGVTGFVPPIGCFLTDDVVLERIR